VLDDSRVIRQSIQMIQLDCGKCVQR
jgi:hypothetical protein